MMRTVRLALIGLCMCGPALANDSTARLDAGGIVFTYSPDIRMDSEDLYISRAEIRVAYRFTNLSDRPIETLVAFPLPPTELSETMNYGPAAGGGANFVGFEATVDGQPVPVSVEVRATRFGLDVTDVLRRHDLPILPMFAEDGFAVLERKAAALSPSARADLERHGLVDWATQAGAGGMPLPNPHWTAKVTLYWFQTFPPGRSIEVKHRYQPVAGAFFFGAHSLEDAALRSEYCMDEGFLRAAGRMVGASEDRLALGRDLGYVLTTANNWMGPIGEFTLTVDKGDPGNLVSLCLDGVRKAGPTTFVLTQKDYSPEENLRVLFLEPLARAE